MRHTYEMLCAEIDAHGWYKYFLRRDDGKEIKVSPKRLAELRRNRQIVAEQLSLDAVL